MPSRNRTKESSTTLRATLIVASLAGAIASLASGCFLSTIGKLDEGAGGGASTSTSSGGSGGSTTSTSSSGSTSSTTVMCSSVAMCPVDKECAAAACEQGVCTTVPVAKGGACLAGKSGVCDAEGHCVTCFTEGATVYGCASGMDCTGGNCTSCNNQTKDNDETDVDCGGSCAGCVDGNQCKVNEDCAKGDCDTSATPPICISCSDSIKNGTETDVDCGGTCASKCALGAACGTNADCASGECKGGQCTACADGVKNGTETDTDCGGLCGLCGIGKACGGNAECANGICADGVCCNSACTGACKSCSQPGHLGTCTNVASGLDDSPTCGNNQTCDGQGSCQMLMGKKLAGAPCTAGSECFNGTCAAGFCKLKVGDPCTHTMDCASGLCAQGTCAACVTTADCGQNSDCTAGVCSLPPGSLCNNAIPGDCFENVCQFGFCTTLKDFGGPCIDQADCKGHLCKGGMCVACTLADCASCNAQGCKAPAGQPCTDGTQCNSGMCSGVPFKHCQ